MVWFGMVLLVEFGMGGGVRGLVSSYMKRFQSWTIMNYHRGGVMTGMNDWRG